MFIGSGEEGIPASGRAQFRWPLRPFQFSYSVILKVSDWQCLERAQREAMDEGRKPRGFNFLSLVSSLQAGLEKTFPRSKF